MCGYWDNHQDILGKKGGELFRTFEIEATVNELSVSVDQKNIRAKIKDDKKIDKAEDNGEADGTHKEKVGEQVQGDFYTSVLASKLGTKAILLQIVPTLNIVSLLVVSTGMSIFQPLITLLHFILIIS